MLEKIKKGKKLGDFNDFIDQFYLWAIECNRMRRQHYFKQGRLFLADTFIYQLCKLESEEEKIELFYSKMKAELNYMISRYGDTIDEHDIEGLLYDSINEVIQLIDTNDIENHKALARTYFYNKCMNLIKYRTTKKRGGGEKPIYIDDNRDDKPQIQIECREKAYDTVDILDWLEQIKPTLSTTEYEYIKLIIEENHSDEMTKVEICQELNISRPTLDKLIKNLKSNKHLIALLHK